jgi:hypothetical protein
MASNNTLSTKTAEISIISPNQMYGILDLIGIPASRVTYESKLQQELMGNNDIIGINSNMEDHVSYAIRGPHQNLQVTSVTANVVNNGAFKTPIENIKDMYSAFVARPKDRPVKLIFEAHWTQPFSPSQGKHSITIRSDGVVFNYYGSMPSDMENVLEYMGKNDLGKFVILEDTLNLRDLI